MKKIIIISVLISTSTYAKTTKNIDSEITKLLAHDPVITQVQEVVNQGLNRASTAAQPWSGSYWPDITGSITNHYRDRTKLWNQAFFALGYQVSKIRFMNNFEDVQKSYLGWDHSKLNEKLSPSEKYDLLVGNHDFNFTKAILEELDFRASHKPSFVSSNSSSTKDTEIDPDDNHESSRFSEDKRKNGFTVWRDSSSHYAYWSGICDGWSPASIYLPRPVKPVTVKSFDGSPITFYPDDLKALGSYLFARTNTPYFASMQYSFAGQACREKGKPKLNHDGKVEDSACNDLDPGVWHLALVNRIGVDKTGFIMDVDNNVKINNHPVFYYELEYFNPKTGKIGSLKDSIIARAEMRDSFENYRDPKAKSLVGVRSKVKMSFYIWAEDHHELTSDSVSEDKTKDEEYTYDLELDEDGKILGGEWGDRSNENGEKSRYAKQPDFIWMAPLHQLPYSQMSSSTIQGDYLNNKFEWAWDGKSTLPEDWIAAAKEDQKWSPPVLNNQYSKLKSAQVLSNIIYKLFEMAKE